MNKAIISLNKKWLTAVMVVEIIFFSATLIFTGYEFGLYQAKKKAIGRILNEYCWEYEGRPQVYNSDFMRLTEAERDSVRLDATNKLK